MHTDERGWKNLENQMFALGPRMSSRLEFVGAECLPLDSQLSTLTGFLSVFIRVHPWFHLVALPASLDSRYWPGYTGRDPVRGPRTPKEATP